MRLLSLRAVKSTFDSDVNDKRRVSSPVQSDAVWDGSGFAVAAQVDERSEHSVEREVEAGCLRKKTSHKNKSRKEKKVLKNKCQNEDSKNDAESLRVTGLVPRVIYNSDSSMEVLPKMMSATSLASFHDMRKEVARVVLQSMVSFDGAGDSNDDDYDNVQIDDQACKLTGLHSVEVRRKSFNHEDRYGVPEAMQSMTMSVLGSDTFEILDVDSKAADDVHREREIIREAIVKSMSVASSSSAPPPKSEDNNSSIGNFWLRIFNCHAPTVPVSPHPFASGNNNITTWHESISLSSISG